MKTFSIFSITHPEGRDSSPQTAHRNSKVIRDFLNHCTHYDDMEITAAYGDHEACVDLAEHYLETKVELPELKESSLLALAYKNKCVFILADVKNHFKQ